MELFGAVGNWESHSLETLWGAMRRSSISFKIVLLIDGSYTCLFKNWTKETSLFGPGLSHVNVLCFQVSENLSAKWEPRLHVSKTAVPNKDALAQRALVVVTVLGLHLSKASCITDSKSNLWSERMSSRNMIGHHGNKQSWIDCILEYVNTSRHAPSASTALSSLMFYLRIDYWVIIYI